MSELEFEKWWALHIRSARGESLTDDERALYHKGLRELHGQEALFEDLDSMRKAREAVMALDSRCDQLHARRKQLKERIAHLEASLSPEVRRSLGIED
jgi:hypothetical protein